jgi:alkaline phosphatase
LAYVFPLGTYVFSILVERDGVLTCEIHTEAPTESPVYKWYPEVLAHANASAEQLSRRLRDHVASIEEPPDDLMDWINTNLVIAGLGITDARDVELGLLASNPLAAQRTFAQMVSRRARIGWSTHGHSAVDVNIYSSGGPGTEKIRGNVENTDIGEFLREYLDVDVDEITDELRKKMRLPSPAGKPGWRRCVDCWDET